MKIYLPFSIAGIMIIIVSCQKNLDSGNVSVEPGPQKPKDIFGYNKKIATITVEEEHAWPGGIPCNNFTLETKYTFYYDSIARKIFRKDTLFKSAGCNLPDPAGTTGQAIYSYDVNGIINSLYVKPVSLTYNPYTIQVQKQGGKISMIDLYGIPFNVRYKSENGGEWANCIASAIYPHNGGTGSEYKYSYWAFFKNNGIAERKDTLYAATLFPNRTDTIFFSTEYKSNQLSAEGNIVASLWHNINREPARNYFQDEQCEYTYTRDGKSGNFNEFFEYLYGNDLYSLFKMFNKSTVIDPVRPQQIFNFTNCFFWFSGDVVGKTISSGSSYSKWTSFIYGISETINPVTSILYYPNGNVKQIIYRNQQLGSNGFIKVSLTYS